MRTTLVALTAATLFLALSGFDCASSEMSTAKLALQRKDLQKAEESLKQEIAKRPQNGEAWMMLGEIYETQARFPEMNDAYEKALTATTLPLTPAQRNNVFAKRYNAWLENYNSALGFYNEALKSDDKALYQKALASLDAAQKIRPDYAENLYLRATIYRGMQDQTKEMQAYKSYIDAVEPIIKAGMADGLVLGMTADQVEAKLGKAAAKEVVDTLGGYMFFAPKNLYVYFMAVDKGQAPRVEGWRYYADESTPDFIKQATYMIRSAPYYALGVDAYYAGETNKSRYDEALKYLQIVQKLDAQQERVGQVIADIYSRTGRTAEARTSFEQSIRDNPNEPSLYINYGTLLVNLKDYTGAIRNFEKALGLTKEGEERHKTALFNLGAVYKNWGAQLQDSIRAIVGDKMSKAQIEVYSAKLRESVRYFEQYAARYGGNDFIALAELGNLYIVLGDETKLNRTISQLEGLRSSNDTDADYWLALSRLYLIQGDTRKSEAALKRHDELNK